MAKGEMPLQKQKAKKRDRAATQKRLLEAAVHVFASQGYDAATTKEIAERAGAAEALIHRYFEGKQGLLLALMRDFAQGEKDSCLNMPPKEKTFEREVKSLLNHAIVNCANRKDYLKVAIPRALVDRAVGKELTKFLESARVPTLLERVKKHQSDGTLSREEDAEVLAYSIALQMLALGFLGQILLRIDPKLTNRIVDRFAEAYSCPRQALPWKSLRS